MEELLRLYERPPDPAEPVLCVDEKPVLLRDEVAPWQPARPGRSARRDSAYRRCGAANVFCVIEPGRGRHFTRATPNRTGVAFARLLRDLVRRYPRARVLHLVLDNLSTHARSSLVRAFGPARADRLWRRLRLHFTPVHASWLNPAEIEASLLSRQCLAHRRLASFDHLEREVRAWNRSLDDLRLPIHWRFDRAAARRVFAYQPARI